MSEPLLNGREDNEFYDEWVPKEKKPFFKRPCVLVGGCLAIFFTLSGIAIALTTSYPLKVFQQKDEQPVRNVIMMISDGLGPASISFSRTYYQYMNQQPYDYQMPLDTIFVGQSRTRSSNSLVTDSAAGATAFSCGLKTYNGAIGVDPNANPCGTLLEAAKHQREMLTGLVVTSRVTHATPAAFSAHVTDRNDETNIALQQIGENPLGRTVDLLFGGGSCQFLPECREDGRNLLNEAKEKYNWTTVLYHDRQGFDNLKAEPGVLPAISVFSADHMEYDIDRNNTSQPSLSEMTEKALDILTNSAGEKGFYLMIEGSRIDMAGHVNDAAAHVYDILAYQKTIELVKKYVEEHPDTIMISTSDHETGGLALARQETSAFPEYLWYPDVISKVRSSTPILANQIHNQTLRTTKFITNLLKNGLGITDPSRKEVSALIAADGTNATEFYLSNMVSLRAQLGWSTHGHSGVDVNLYAYGNRAEQLRGSHENTDIGHFMKDILSLDLDQITLKLNENNNSFQLSHLTLSDKLKFSETLEHYHH